MIRRKRINLIVLFFLAITLIFTSSIKFADKEYSTWEIEDKLDNISEEEKEILEYLFIQVQEIDEMERENKRILGEMETIKDEVEDIEDRIYEEEINYEKNLLALETILKSYQRLGPASYLEIIIKSESLADFIHRINILRDLTRNTDNVLTATESSKERLVEEKSNLYIKLSLLEEKQVELEDTIAKKQILVDENEKYLESLAGDRELYLERLEYISMIMEEARKVLGEFTTGFSKIIEEGNFPEDAVKETITLRGIKGTVGEKVFNDIVNDYSWLPKVEIKFYQGKIEMKAPKKKLILIGEFEIVDNQILKFVPEEGSFLGMPLGKGAIEELFEDGDFVLDFEPLIGKNILKSVEIKDGYLEVLVTLKLF